jgi:hypothetical protein
MRDFGLPGALWLAAEQTGVFSLLESLWPQPRSGHRELKKLFEIADRSRL